MNEILIIAIVALTMISSVRAQEPIQHELPIVTHWSNEKNAFEYMANDKPDYTVPPPEEKYRPGDSYYYYREGNSNFLPDLNHYVGMNFSLRTFGAKRVSDVAEQVAKETGVELKFYRPDAFTSRNAPTRLKEAPGYVQVLHAKIIKSSDDDPGCLATFFLPPKKKKGDVRLHVDHIVRAGHAFRRTPQGGIVLHEKLWEALSQFVDPKAPKGPLVDPGK